MGVRIRDNRRPGKIVIDWDGHDGRRRWKTFPKTKEGERQARIYAGDLERKLARHEPMPDERVTFESVSREWMLHVRATVSPQTADTYQSALKALQDEFGRRPIVRITRGAFKAYVERLLATEAMKRSSVKVRVVGVARNLFGWACLPEQGYLGSNPATNLGLFKRSADRPVAKSMTRDQLSAFLASSKRLLNEDEHLTHLTLARTGLRLAEGQGLQWPAFLDEEDGTRLAVTQQVLKRGGIGPVKSRHGNRRVDVSTDLRDAFRATWARRQEDRIRLGIPMSPWILCPEFLPDPPRNQVERARQRTARAMRRVMAASGLAGFSPHSLRHTFVTLLLEQGEPIQWVQQQAGHASITQTMQYAEALKAKSPGAVDRMAELTKPATGASVVELKSGGGNQ